MALETSQSIMDGYGVLLGIVNSVIQAIFVCEIGVRIAAHAPRCMTFFRNGWNVYDFAIVALSTLPLAGSFVNVARLARVLRITRLVSYSSELRMIVSAMLRSIPSMAHVVLLLFMLLYIYAIVGFYYFSAVDSERWGTLGQCLLTLFQILTLEDWTDVLHGVALSSPWAWLYFVSFIIIAVFVVMNLFIAVVINNLQAVRSEGLVNAAVEHTPDELYGLIEQARRKLDEIETLVGFERRR